MGTDMVLYVLKIATATVVAGLLDGSPVIRKVLRRPATSTKVFLFVVSLCLSINKC
jgi:hypothetical protein